MIYTYRGGWGDPPRAALRLGHPGGHRPFDIGAAAAALQSAPDTLRIAPGDVEETFIDIDHIAEPPGQGHWNC